MFYTYIHRQIDVPGIAGVFYVGKGSQKRAWQETSRSDVWELRAAQTGFTAEIVARWPSERDAFDHERKLIAEFKAMGAPLVNMTEGGDGVRLLPEIIKRRAATLRATNLLPAIKQKRSMAIKRLFDDPDFCERHAEAARACCRVPEILAKKRAAIKRVHADSEIQSRRIDAIRSAARVPEYRDKKRRISLENGNRPPTYHGGDHPMARKVICIETGQLFVTVRSAVSWLKSTGLSKASPSFIVAVCRGRESSAYKYHWRYAET